MTTAVEPARLRIEDWMKVINSVAYRVWRRSSAAGARSLQIEDIRAELCIAWCVARDGFDPQRGVPFEPYLRRGMFHHINRFVQNEIDQRLNTIDLDRPSGADEGDNDLHEAIPDGADDAETLLARQDFFARVARLLSPRARMFIELLSNPPPELYQEFDAVRARAAYARSRGFATISPHGGVSTSFIFEFMQVERGERQRIVQEVEKAIAKVRRRIDD